MMKITRLLVFMAALMGASLSCNSQSNQNNAKAQIAAKGVEVYYFHYTHRCETCKAVESVSKEAIAELYGNKVSFTSYNLDEPQGETKGKELGVAGQTLLIVDGKTQINITTEGFMNARNNPDKLKQIIKEKIDALL